MKRSPPVGTAVARQYHRPTLADGTARFPTARPWLERLETGSGRVDRSLTFAQRFSTTL
ncbi:hypothetical protein [Pseudomonas sp.]|uniref:hypothetical protein n=1 Tax=Pseudomonas sp. TaxID=306 RepID=UPI0028A84233|nr:hypothetical protein [Pseudomonas sp.]